MTDNKTNESIISVRALQKSFADNHVLKGVDLEIAEGERIAIIGPSGCGKSTFLRCLNCMEDPTGGSIFFEGVDIADQKVDINIHREKIGMVFQQFNLFNNKTVIQNIMLAPVYVGLRNLRRIKRKNSLISFTNLFRKADKKKELLPIETTKEEIIQNAKNRALELLSRIGLEEKADVYPSTLSGGQKQRIAIAGVLAMEPECIILDEPTAMLDPSGRKEVIKTIRELNKKRGMTVVLITHYMDEAALADRVVVMEDGKVIIDDVPKKVFSEVEKIKAIGLDVPQVTELLYRLRGMGIDMPEDIITVEECKEVLLQKLKGLEK